MPTRTRSNTKQYPEQHERAAARKYLEHDYSAKHLSGDAGQTANQHAQAIDEEHPRARDIALTGTERELGKLPKHLAGHQRSERRLAYRDSREVVRVRNEYRSGPYREPDQEDKEEEASKIGAAAGQAAALAASGAKAAKSTSTGELVLEFFAWGIGLSILYLLLTSSKGVTQLVKGITNTTHAIVSPAIDPLNPKGTLK